MTSQLPDVEILVHVGAPSLARDDVTYRRLAEAYLAFEPQQRLQLSHIPLSQELGSFFSDGTSQRVAQSSFCGSDDAVPQSHPLPELASQDLSFRSVLDNRHSPVLAVGRFETSRHAVQSSSPVASGAARNSWRQPPSQISDSYPLPDADILHVSPTRVLQRYLGRNSTIGQSTTTRSASQVSTEVNTSPSKTWSSPVLARELGRDQDRSTSQLNARQTIPVTPLYNKLVPQPKRGLNQEHNDTVVNETTYIPSSFTNILSTSSSFRAESEPPPSKRLKTASELIGEPLALVRSSSDSSRLRARTLPTSDQSLEIRPPSPPVGVGDIGPTDLVSKKLDKLASDLSSRYRPIAKRKVEPFDRGYWQLDCTSWSSDTQADTWKFLVNYIGSGLAGWGVWCRRDASHHSIRLYCWGHIVKHTYLLLYLASGRQLKTTGAKWIDADGEVALEVLSHGRQR